MWTPRTNRPRIDGGPSKGSATASENPSTKIRGCSRTWAYWGAAKTRRACPTRPPLSAGGVPQRHRPSTRPSRGLKEDRRRLAWPCFRNVATDDDSSCAASTSDPTTARSDPAPTPTTRRRRTSPSSARRTAPRISATAPRPMGTPRFAPRNCTMCAAATSWLTAFPTSTSRSTSGRTAPSRSAWPWRRVRTISARATTTWRTATCTTRSRKAWTSAPSRAAAR